MQTIHTSHTSKTARTRAGLLALSALLLALPALAQIPAPPAAPTAPAAPATAPLAGARTPNPNNGHGRITAISATSITVTPKNGEPKTFTLTPQTKLLLDGQPAAASALTVGLHASVNSRDGVTARRVNARTEGFKKAATVGTAGKTAPIRPAATL